MKKKKLPKEERIALERKAMSGERAYIWARVSSPDQFHKNNSIDIQIKACQDYCDEHNIEVLGIKNAENESAKVAGEKFLGMISEALLDPKVNVIVCYDFDRFSRNASDGIAAKAKLKQAGITVKAINQPIDDDNILAESFQDLLIVFANMDNSMRRNKCRAGMVSCLERGEWYSRPPMGYDSKKVGKKHIITVNEKGEILRNAFLWKANENISNEEILAKLKSRGLSMYKQQLSGILRNPFYCGKIQHYLLEGKVVDGTQEKLVSEEIWNKVQENLSGNHDNYEHKEQTPDFPLKRHVYCFADGSAMTGYMSKKIYPYYKCNVKGCKTNVKASIMHEEYRKLLDDFCIPEEYWSIFKQVINDLFNETYASIIDRNKALEKKIEECKKQIKDIGMKYALDKIPEDVYTTATEQTKERQVQLEKELALIPIPLSELTDFTDYAIVTSSKLGTLWSMMDFELSQRIQKLVHPQGIFWDNANKCYRTKFSNQILGIIRFLCTSVADLEKKNMTRPETCHMVVAGAGLEPAASGL